MSSQTSSSPRFIQFGAFTEQDWRAFAVCEITKPCVKNNITDDNTPYDKRLGSLGQDEQCATCGLRNNLCPGHFGFISLNEPVYNPVYFKTITSLLKCICLSCKRPRISADNASLQGLLAMTRNSRFKVYKKRCENVKSCPSCKGALPKITAKDTSIYYSYGKGTPSPLTARASFTLFLQITIEDLDLMGFNHGLSPNKKFHTSEVHHHVVRPEAFIFTVLPVIPSCIRPYVLQKGVKKDDDLTEKYNAIIRANNKLQNLKITEEKKRLELQNQLRDNIWALIMKDKSANTTSKVLSLTNRLSGKTGHIQSNVAGKRVDFTTRTVIVGGGYLIPNGWVGVPEYVAKIETVPELVTSFNYEFLRILVVGGEANYVRRQERTISLKNIDNFFELYGDLQIGDIVERQLRNGDWGVFNRQPTLRLESMQGVQSKIMKKEYVFRLPLGNTRAYNADHLFNLMKKNQ